jgi:prepilin peptidase CpaA
MYLRAERPSSLSPLTLPFEEILSVGAATLVGASVVVLAGGDLLPGLGVAVFLMLVVEQDVRRGKIPNWLTFSAFGTALAYSLWTAGAHGLLFALAGSAVGLAVLVLPFLMRFMGAGDVKAVMVLGALFGPRATLELLWWITLVAGVLAIALMSVRGGLPDLVRRWWLSLKLSVLSQRPCYVGPQADSKAVGALPFGVAIGFGVAACRTWGTLCF